MRFNQWKYAVAILVAPQGRKPKERDANQRSELNPLNQRTPKAAVPEAPEASPTPTHSLFLFTIPRSSTQHDSQSPAGVAQSKETDIVVQKNKIS
jgi:hypothetical protein